MSIPAIIIAASDPYLRNRMARVLGDQAGPVAATASAACLMAGLLRGGRPIVILGDGLEEGLSLAALVLLLKRCNRRATVILAADGISRAEEIKARQHGIFCRTERPADSGEWDDLQMAVACARNCPPRPGGAARWH